MTAPDSQLPTASHLRLTATALAQVAALGAVGGFLLGSVVLGLLQHGAPGGWSWVDVPFSMIFGGTFGAIVGAVGAPLSGWLFFRHVTLGRAMTITAIGTLAGAALGQGIGGWPLSGGCLGFLLAGFLLRFTQRAA